MLMLCRLLIVAVFAASVGYYPGVFTSNIATGFGLLSDETSVTRSSWTTTGVTLKSIIKCRLSEYQCENGHCIAQDKFCDGENDCNDKSDEPKYCSPCNRTLYGDVGRTYKVEIRRPREDRLPFICYLNFTAASGDFGDLVQLTFDTFTVGRFLSFTNDGCPDGFMTICEEGRPATGGQWCGSAWGYTVYYSETASINLTLYLARLSEQGIGYNFDFKLSYKFLKRSEAHLRYGNSTMATWRGDLVNGTYCDRVLTRCDTRACRLQSPNYPGVYPRNVTCYYRIEHKRAPPGHRALLSVNQRNSHKIHIKDQIVKYDRSQRILRVWDQCNVVQDYLTVYDGSSTTDRVLVRLCGGDAVPDIVSSHNTMLLEFHTSPYDNPFHPVPLSFLPGFELEVNVIFVDDKSRSFVKENTHCDFYITSYESLSGVLENPKHSLPPNTTCRYHFQGKPNEIVWISFVKYYASTTDPSTANIDSNNECNAKLLIWDGDKSPEKQSSGKKIRLMGQFCKEEIPLLCDHSLLRNSSRHTRPCSLTESYVSSGRDLTLEHILRQGSALYPISFVLRYEFVHNAISCHQVFSSSSTTDYELSIMKKTSGINGKFTSPKSVFFYGRGGAQNLSCIYRFEADTDQKIEITISKASFGDKICMSYVDPLTNKWACDRQLSNINKNGYAELIVSEYPWSGVQLIRDCLCSNITDPIVLTSITSNVVELAFIVTHMNITQDYNDFMFQGNYRFISTTVTDNSDNSDSNTGSDGSVGGGVGGGSDDNSETLNINQVPCTSRFEERKLSGTSGEISLKSPILPNLSLKQQKHQQQQQQQQLQEKQQNQLRITEVATVEEILKNTEGLTVTQCINGPWLIEPDEPQMNYLYLRTKGFIINPDNIGDCKTLNRIIIYSAINTRDKSVVCPEEYVDDIDLNTRSRTLDFFSGGWNYTTMNVTLSPLISMAKHSRSFVVEFIQREPGYYTVTWIAISKSAAISQFPGDNSPIILTPPNQCPYRCPEIQACISSVLWCDGIKHCPSGFDEEEINCSYRFGVTLLYVAIGAGALGIFLIFLLATGCLKYCLYRHKTRQKKKKKKKKKNVNPLNVNHHHHVNHTHNHHHQNNGLNSSNQLSGQYNIAPSQEMFIDNYGKDSIC